MTILSVVYASAPAGETIIPAIKIVVPGRPAIRICADFADHMLGLDGVYESFEGGSLSVSLPAKNASGQQTLRFGVGNVNGQAQRYVDDALEAGSKVTLIYFEYLESDKSAPARRPYTMTIVGGKFEGVEAQFDASYQDLLNYAWPRERYTAESAPGLKYT
ncbi:DUF1833 family protein [Pusillimonas sp. ANT_WB101]|uniref:DUF1833 family protein n=1 Tax=Pusillimonas sp. ANT_WB101 TaxID=2597356 RepID=UPI0011EDB82E|nr:DUF1833 family protein [Pusillimonas sp. ANT_WB101]KAA0910689.1 DUF1833 domain-containing protein [Pusillimonas sp. ANT_WB101]